MTGAIANYVSTIDSTVADLKKTIEGIGEKLKMALGHILILDDEPTILSMMEGVLGAKAELSGAILKATNKKDVIALLKQHDDIRIAIVDYFLAEGPADSVIDIMLAKGLKVICVSGDRTGAADIYCTSRGIKRYVKPVRVSSLMEDIKNLLSEDSNV